jgi:TPR repeat protein
VRSILLGKRYENGDLVPQDYKLAAKWYRKAATKGHGQAKEALKKYRKTLFGWKYLS